MPRRSSSSTRSSALAQVSAFSLAAVLAGLALVTLVIKTWLEWRYADQLAATRSKH